MEQQRESKLLKDETTVMLEETEARQHVYSVDTRIMKDGTSSRISRVQGKKRSFPHQSKFFLIITNTWFST